MHNDKSLGGFVPDGIEKLLFPDGFVVTQGNVLEAVGDITYRVALIDSHMPSMNVIDLRDTSMSHGEQLRLAKMKRAFIAARSCLTAAFPDMFSAGSEEAESYLQSQTA